MRVGESGELLLEWYTTHCRVREDAMPTISMFYGILIRMFFDDAEKHHAPHIHAAYQDYEAVYSIVDGAVLAGSLPLTKHKPVVAWVALHHDDLQANWELAMKGRKLFRIRGFDQ